jgi:hypothetical protein
MQSAAHTARRRAPLRDLGWPRIPPALGVGVLCLALVAAVSALIRHEHGLSGDEPFYEQMARHPGAPHNFPYAYRIGVPWLVHILPFSHVASFTALAWLGIAAAAAALYLLLTHFRTEPRLAWALCVGFALSPTLLVALARNGRSIDPASILVMVLGCLFIVRRQRVALGVTMLLGVTVRESTLFLIPLAYVVWARRPLDIEALRDTALTALAPAAAYVALRTSIDALGRQYEPGYSGPFLDARFDLIGQALGHGGWPVELRRLAYTYGPLWFVAPFALRDLRFARQGLVLVALCLASMTIAYDWGRIIFLAAPVFYVAAAHVLRHRSRLAVVTVIALLAVDVGYGVYLQAYGVSHGLDSSVGRGIPVY